MSQVPLVDYLVLGDEPHLVAHECPNCGARYFGRRNACASCATAPEFTLVPISTRGTLRTFTIVAFGAPGVPVPNVPAIIDCDGTSVQGIVVNIEPDAEHIELGMDLQLTTYVVGTDSEGNEAIGYAFEPVEATA